MRSSLTAYLVALVLAAAVAGPGAGLPGGPPAAAQEQSRTITVTARRYAFDPAVIEVRQDDLVKIAFRAEDIPHSFAIDDYRIAKRAGAGQTVTFEFRADRAGSFPFYCNLKSDSGCRQMRGTLVVRPR
jgi:heme/copper-type cytochrome/quinol oxidase subunit 2